MYKNCRVTNPAFGAGTSETHMQSPYPGFQRY